ncbi:MAG TPA: DUF5050 domain-containing protein [Desulfosporosinus sp.]|nr:DUF5050 domain-containing protein [Desulfosporosinus sp.]
MDPHGPSSVLTNQLDQSKLITLDEDKLYLDGNTESNINNYGLVAETNDSIFYLDIEKNTLCRTDRDLSYQVVLFDQDSEKGKDTINVIGDWVFFRQGKEIKRMKIDGSNVNHLFTGYSIQMHVVGNWIYFLNLSDSSKLYKMDVNGQNREVLCDKEVYDMAIYDGKIYYSYDYKKESYLEVMNLDGTGKQLLINVKTRNMVVDKDYIYYNDVDDKLYRLSLKSNSVEALSTELIMKFVKDDHWIFYTLKAPIDSRERFKGLYRMNLDGSNVVALNSDVYLDELGLGISEDWIFYGSLSRSGTPRSTDRIKKDGSY